MRSLELGAALLLTLVASSCAPARQQPATQPPPPAEPSQTARPAPPIRLCGWNLRKLGHGSATDYALVADVIGSRCDIAAIVEVMQKQGQRPGYDRLIGELNLDGPQRQRPRWAGSVTDRPRPNSSAGHAEYYAVLWRIGVVTHCGGAATLDYFADNDGSPGGSGPDRFQREPAFGCFRSVQQAPDAAGRRPGTDFVLGLYHARWSDGDERAIAAEVRQLGLVFEAMSRAFAGERDLMLIGDFNLRPAPLSRALPFADRTEGSGSTLNRKGERPANLYDHLVVHDEQATVELIGNARVVDVRDVAPSPESFYRTVSDHLPIVVELRVDRPDDD